MSDEQPPREASMSTTATTTAKEEVIEMLRHLPDNVTFDEILYHIEMLEGLRLSEQDSREGRVITNAEFKERMKEWLTV